jgi:hypothetical protein
VPAYPLKSEVEMSKPRHGVKHVEVQLSANKLGIHYVN